MKTTTRFYRAVLGASLILAAILLPMQLTTSIHGIQKISTLNTTETRLQSASNTTSSFPLPQELCERLVGDEHLHRRHEQTSELDRLDREYALNSDVLRTGFVPGELKIELLRKLATSEPITVLTLGGSFTRGHGCGETPAQDERYCAWPARLERWWKAYLTPGVLSHWIHAAEHGAGSVSALQRIGVMVHALARKPDLVILDFLVNDVFQGEDATVGYESLIRAIHELLPTAQIFSLEAGCRDCLKDKRVIQRRRQVALHYGVPTIDYAAMVQVHNKVDGVGPDVLWPNSGDPQMDPPYVVVGSAWPDFVPSCNATKATCCPNNHPPWLVHQLVSDSIAFGLIQMLKKKGCSRGNQPIIQEPFHTQGELDAFPVCKKPLLWHDALAAMARNGTASHDPITDGGKWRLYEDKPGRPGWITTEQGSTITFPIEFGAQPILAVTYLRSYDHLGVAEVRFTAKSGNSGTVHLNGIWDKNYSLPNTAFFIDRGDGIHGDLLGSALACDGYNPYDGGWKDGSGGNGKYYNVSISLVGGEKFKILQVISC